MCSWQGRRNLPDPPFSTDANLGGIHLGLEPEMLLMHVDPHGLSLVTQALGIIHGPHFGQDRFRLFDPD
jgi:hypothetical protein